MARHSDIRMTMRYTHIGLDEQAKAVTAIPAWSATFTKPGTAKVVRQSEETARVAIRPLYRLFLDRVLGHATRTVNCLTLSFPVLIFAVLR